MKKLLTIIIFLILLAVLGFFFVDLYAERIQKEIESSVKTSMRKKSFDNISVSVDGRDVKLTGRISSKASLNKVGQVAKEVIGVRMVNNFVKLEEKKIEPPSSMLIPKVALPNNQRDELAGIGFTAHLPPLDNSLEVEAKLPPVITNPKITIKNQPENNSSPTAEIIEAKQEAMNEQPEATEAEPSAIKEEVFEVKEVVVKKLEPTEPMKQVVQHEKVKEVKIKKVATTIKAEPKETAKVVNNPKSALIPTKVQTPAKPKLSFYKKANNNCRTKVSQLTSSNQIRFRGKTEYIEYETGNILSKIGQILKSCPRSKLVIETSGYDSLAKKRADNVANFLKNIEQIPQPVSTKVEQSSYGRNSITFKIINR